MSWGTTEWGTSSFGASFALSLNRAFAISTRAIRVMLNDAPAAISKFAPGDALNPDTWKITRSDTGLTVRVVQVEKISATVFEVRTLRDFGPSPVPHTLSSLTLRDPSGALLSAPYSVNFDGCAALVEFPKPFTAVDIKLNAGVYVMKGGDYDQAEGPELIRRLIYQRIATTIGAFFHLPSYGLGLRVNEPIATSDLIKLKKEVERQVLEEPEVLRASATISVDPTGIVIISIRAQTINFGSLDVAYKSTNPLVTL